MAGYLDAYGARDARRERVVKVLILSITGLLIVAGIGYLALQNYSEKRRAREFLRLVEQQDYRAAYALWGCTESSPCREYPFERFMEDWGPENPDLRNADLETGLTEECGGGVIVNVYNHDQHHASLYIETNTRVISYAPWPECPEPRFRLMKWIRMRLGLAPAG